MGVSSCFDTEQGVQCRMVLAVSCFVFLKSKVFCFVVAMSNIVSDMQATCICPLPYNC